MLPVFRQHVGPRSWCLGLGVDAACLPSFPGSPLGLVETRAVLMLLSPPMIIGLMMGSAYVSWLWGCFGQVVPAWHRRRTSQGAVPSSGCNPQTASWRDACCHGLSLPCPGMETLHPHTWQSTELWTHACHQMPGAQGGGAPEGRAAARASHAGWCFPCVSGAWAGCGVTQRM